MFFGHQCPKTYVKNKTFDKHKTYVKNKTFKKHM
jgi:hypothetical protein